MDVPDDEAERLAALRQLGLLDTPPEERFDRITRTACRLLRVPMSTVTLLDANRQWFKSCIGVSVPETPRSVAFCSVTVLLGETLVIPDASQDPRFSKNPLVTGELHLRFYAGHPLHGPGGHFVGTFCIMDHIPRELTVDELGAFEDLAAWAESELNLLHSSQAPDSGQGRDALQRQLFSGIRDGVIAVDGTGRLLYFNQRAEEMFGYSTSEVIGNHPSMLVSDPTFDARIQSFIARAKEGTGELPPLLELTAVKRSGETFPVELAIGVTGRQDEIIIIAVVRDISERLRAERIHRQIADLLELARDAIFVRDARHHRITAWNRGAATLYGISKAEALGRNPHELLRTQFPVPLAEIERDLYADGAWEGELVPTRRDGTQVIVSSHWVLQRHENGRPAAILEIDSDITAHRRAETVLSERELSLRLAQKIAHLGNWQRDLRTDQAFWSDELLSLLGLAPGSAAPSIETILSSIHPDDVEIMRSRMTRVHPGRSEPIEFRVRHPDGSIRVMQAQTDTLQDMNGNAISIFGTVLDVTDRKRIEDELRAAKEAAETASRAKSDFLAMMSHEIRTPMNGVLGMTELLLDTPLSPEQRGYAETVHRSGESLLRIINDILDVSKLEASRLQLESFDFDLLEIVEDVAGLFAGGPRESNIELTAFVDPAVPTKLRGDPFRLRQIISNLLSNAMKFTERGEVKLRVRLEHEDSEIAVIRVSIRDTGIGMSPDQISYLFRPFTQADISTTRRFGGTGLGLSIVRRFVELMDGSINVVSSPGQGSTFTFTARFAKQSSLAPSDVPLDKRMLAGLRALVVDDSATNREILHHQLTAWGLKEDAATDAESGIRALRAAVEHGEKYDIAILDMQMPRMDGLQMARAIKSNPELANLPLVLLTSVGAHIEKEALASGVAAVLTKPVKQSELFNCLATTIGKRTAQASVPAVAVQRELAQGTGSAKKRILLAEDNTVNRQLAQRILEKSGYAVDAVTNGSEAVSAITNGVYDAVLMNAQMPEMDGYAATEQIRLREGTGRHTPIIAMTANALSGDRERCLQAGMDDYISKPFDIAILRSTLERWVNGSSNVTGSTVQAGRQEKATIDFDKIVALEEVSSRQDVRELITMFLDDAPLRFAALRAAIEAGDAERAEREAHTLKGSTGIFGAQRLSQVMELILQAARNGEVERLKELSQLAERSLLDAERELRSFLARSATSVDTASAM